MLQADQTEGIMQEKAIGRDQTWVVFEIKVFEICIQNTKYVFRICILILQKEKKVLLTDREIICEYRENDGMPPNIQIHRNCLLT